MEMSRAVIESAIGIRPEHFALSGRRSDVRRPREFAIAAELGSNRGNDAAGVLFSEHRNHLTALPRISLNGEFSNCGICGY